MFNKTRSTDQEPTRTEGDGNTTDYYLSHPAFAQISVSRVSGHAVLYGSDFTHQHYIRLAIGGSKISRNSAEDRHFAGKELVEVYMTEAQFAQMITSMNLGGGAPCTLNRFNGESMPTIPKRDLRETFREDINRDLQESIDMLDDLIKSVGEMGLPKGKTAEILAKAQRSRKRIFESAPWVAQQFDEHMENTVEAAKMEINGYLNEAVKSTGISGDPVAPLRLGMGSEN